MLLAGFSLCGLAAAEDLAALASLILAATSQLPAHLPRLLLGTLSPQQMLQAVQCGVDVFDSSWAVELAIKGHALSLQPPVLQAPSKAPIMEAAIRLPPAANGQLAGQSSSPVGAQPRLPKARKQQSRRGEGKLSPAGSSSELGLPVPSVAPAFSAPEMNLWAAEYRADKQPLVPGCSCYACRSHTRAYLHHLLEEAEMTAQVLLEVHNTVQLQAFLAGVRSAIRTGGLAGLDAPRTNQD